MRALPISLGFFVATAVVFLLQLIPIVGIVLMFMAAMLWSVLLINAGMLGVAWEALSGRVSRWWLVFPVAFYGAYFAFAAADHLALRQVSASYTASNARVAAPFDPQRQALAFDVHGDEGGWFVDNYGLPVVYVRNPNYPEGFRSTRMVARDTCSEVRGNKALQAAAVHALGILDGESIVGHKPDVRFCNLGMPERPVLPMVMVSRREDKIRFASLPVTRVTTTIATPDGRSFELSGGVAAPLSWIPRPVLGCGLNSGAAKWQCTAGFWRSQFTPIVAGDSRFNGDSVTLARALALKRVAIADRNGGDATLVRAKMAEIEEATLARQLAAIDRMIADPTAKVESWQTGVVANRPEMLAAKADAIMAGLERAAAVGGSDIWRARESGRILAQLIGELPHDRLVSYGPRLLALYRTNFEPKADGRRSESHWLWESEALLRRLGDLGSQALFVVADRRASAPTVNGAGIEGMCRVGAPGRDQAGPALLDMWSKLERHDRDRRRSLFVAMRRVGVAPPPLGAAAGDQSSPMDELVKEWGDVTPASPPRVCSPREWQARREEQHGGIRRTNLI